MLMVVAPSAAHTGIIARTGFQLSDVALFVCALVGVWLARRALRRRFRG